MRYLAIIGLFVLVGWGSYAYYQDTQSRLKTLQENSENAKSLIIEFTKLRTKLDSNISCACQFALDNAVITNPKNWDMDRVKACSAVASRILKTKNQ